MSRFASIPVLSALLVCLTASATTTPAFAGGDHQGTRLAHKLVGLWEGVDVLDGSTIQLSIAHRNGSIALEYRYTESFFSNCFSDDNKKGRGYLIGTITILNSNEFELSGDGLVCVNDDNTQEDPDGFEPTGSYSQRDDVVIFANVQNQLDNFLHRTSTGGSN